MCTGNSGRRWYDWFRYLVPAYGENRRCVIDSYSDEQLRTSPVARIENEKGSHYGVFMDYVTLLRYIQSLPLNQRCLHEVMLSNHRQKPVFDIDIKSDRIHLEDGETIDDYANSIIEELIDNVITVLKDKEIEIDIETQVVLFTSHGSTETGEKRSFHMVLDGLCHTNMYHMKLFYDEIMKISSERLREAVDNIYSKNHCIRMCWNYKLNSTRVKQYCPSYPYHGKIVTHKIRYETLDENHFIAQIFAISLVCTVFDSTIIPWSDTDYAPTVSKPMPTDHIKEAMYIWMKFHNSTVDDFPFTYHSSKGSCIFVKRLKASMCAVCLRTHMNRPPYLRVDGTEVHWVCKGLIDRGILIDTRDQSANVPMRQSIIIGYMVKRINIIGVSDVISDRCTDLSQKIKDIRDRVKQQENQIASANQINDETPNSEVRTSNFEESTKNQINDKTSSIPTALSKQTTENIQPQDVPSIFTIEPVITNEITVNLHPQRTTVNRNRMTVVKKVSVKNRSSELSTEIRYVSDDVSEPVDISDICPDGMSHLDMARILSCKTITRRKNKGKIGK